MYDTSSTQSKTILLVEDDQDFAYGILMSLRRAGFETTHVTTLAAAQQALHNQPFDAILLDLTLPDARGIEVVSAVRQAQRTSTLIVLTGNNDAELAVKALRLGAQDYLTKPIKTQDLLKILRATMQQRTQQTQNQNPQPSAHTLQVIGDSPIWQRTLQMIQAAANAPKTTVLVTGEPGVGKEIAVKLIHQLSQRSTQPLLAVNVACLPTSLMESELFGHESGAFTGARNKKRGLFEQADNGSLFLDEIGELTIELQAKLLRVLEGQPFRRLGGERDLNPDVRLLSATNRSLNKMVEDGSFREDLYHRLKVFEIPVPPLRKRGDDVKKLALHFMARLGAQMGYKDAYISPTALHSLQNYHWPGNIRELKNVIERALVLSQGETVMLHHLPEELQQQKRTTREMRRPDVTPLPRTKHTPPPPSTPIPTSAFDTPLPSPQHNAEDLRLDVVIHKHVKQVLALCDGNVSKAAKTLGITRQTLRRKLEPPNAEKTN